MHSTSPHYRHLQPEDRMTLASLQQQSYGIRAMARALNRSPSTHRHRIKQGGRSYEIVRIRLGAVIERVNHSV